MDKKGQLEVEVIRARGLIPKPGSKSLPAPYVKVYLLDSGACKAKKKTKIARKTLEPLYQQHLLFEESPRGKVLQLFMLPSVDSLLACRFMAVEPPRGSSTAMPVSTLRWMLLLPDLPDFLPVGASVTPVWLSCEVLRLRLDGSMATTRCPMLERRFLTPLPSAVSDWLPSACSMP
ncbi:hypothetical protein CRUP_017702 [Coryphaenoides rupestris]|nr:hypothetical protein CRUP_017702 [Coryphaenoides rupestris]